MAESHLNEGRPGGRGDPRCSFCGKGRLEVGALVEGPGLDGAGGAYICRECVTMALSIFEQEPGPGVGDTLHDPG